HRILQDFLLIERILQDAVCVTVQRPFEALDQPLECAWLQTMDGHGEILLGTLDGAGGLAACPRVLHGLNNTPFGHSVRASLWICFPQSSSSVQSKGGHDCASFSPSLSA